MTQFQAENTAGLRNGSRTRRNGIALAALAKRHGAISVDLRRLKRTLDPYVQHRQGAEPLKAVAAVNEICRWEMSARVMQKTLATETLSPELTLSYLNSISNCTRQRNSLLTKLLGKGADTAADDPWACLLEPPPPQQGNASGANGHQGDTLDGPAESGPGATPEGLGSSDTPRQNSTADSSNGNSTAGNSGVQNSTAGNSTAVEISFGRGGE